MADKIILTDPQREAAGQVMADHFGAHFQTGRRLDHDKEDWVYVDWQYGPNLPVRQAFIDPTGTVVYAE